MSCSITYWKCPSCGARVSASEADCTHCRSKPPTVSAASIDHRPEEPASQFGYWLASLALLGCLFVLQLVKFTDGLWSALGGTLAFVLVPAAVARVYCAIAKPKLPLGTVIFRVSLAACALALQPSALYNQRVKPPPQKGQPALDLRKPSSQVALDLSKPNEQTARAKQHKKQQIIDLDSKEGGAQPDVIDLDDEAQPNVINLDAKAKPPGGLWDYLTSQYPRVNRSVMSLILVLVFIASLWAIISGAQALFKRLPGESGLSHFGTPSIISEKLRAGPPAQPPPVPTTLSTSPEVVISASRDIYSRRAWRLAVNRKQRRCIFGGIAVMVLMGIYPPWVEVMSYIHRVRPLGYRWIFAPPWWSQYGVELDFSRLLLQWAIVALTVTGLVVAFGSESRAGAG